jgi:branched-chain amino acid transport system permease protein
MTATKAEPTPDDAIARPSTDRPRLRRPSTSLVLAALALLALPAVADPIALRRYAGLIVLSLGVLGVVVATGYGGLISLGHGVFVGLGAFTMGSLLDQARLPFLVALPLTFVATSAVGWMLGLPALRIKGIYLALVTLGVGILFPALAKQFPTFSGGVSGRAIDAEFNPPAWTGLDESQTVLWRYLFCLAVCALMFWLTANVLNGPVGRGMQAVRDDETAAASFGVNLTRTKAGAFGLSAGLAGVGGALQVVLFPFISHEQYTIFLSFRLYAAALLGGVATLAGAVWGVVALVLIPAINNTFDLLDNDVLVFGVGLIILTFVSPDGIAGLLSRATASRGGSEQITRFWRNVRSRYSG